MDAKLLIESKWLFAAGFGLNGVPLEPTVTIEKVGREKVDKETWGLLYFREEWARPYKINRTAQRALIAMFGGETDNWVGKRLTLFGLPGTYFGEQGVAVRIKGSPDLKAPVSFTVRKGKGRDLLTHNLIPTGVRAAKGEGVAVASPGPHDGKPTQSGTAGPAPAPVAPAPGPQLVLEPSPKSQPKPSSPPTGGPFVGFGPFKKAPDGSRRTLASLDDGELLESVQFGEAKIIDPASKGEPWLPSVTAEVGLMRAEMERRFTARMSAPPANSNPAPAAPSREPGADDVDPKVPPF